MITVRWSNGTEKSSDIKENGKNGGNIRKGNWTTGAVSTLNAAHRLRPGMNSKARGTGGIDNGWRNSVYSSNAKKCAAANGGNISAMNRKCAAANLKTNGNGGIVNGWNNSGMSTNCDRSKSSCFLLRY